MSERFGAHCPACGTVAKALGMTCICPCHTWKYRRCSCGKVRSLVYFVVSHGPPGGPHLTVNRAVCDTGCGKAWPKDMEWGDCEEKTMDRWEEGRPSDPVPKSFICETCGVAWELTDTPRGEEYQVMV